MATKLATLRGLRDYAPYAVEIHLRESAGSQDDPAFAVPAWPRSAPRSPLAPRITATDDGWALSLIVLCVATIVPWLIGVGWLLTMAMMAAKGWIG